MYGRMTTRTQRAERIAGQAWENLVSAVDNAGTATRSATRRAAATADDVTDRVGSAAREARRRANDAYDALAGRRPARPWGWFAMAGLVGAVAGWVATVFGRQLVARGDEMAFERSIADAAADARRGRTPTTVA